MSNYTNYVKNPWKAGNLSREKLLSELNRLENMALLYSDRDEDMMNFYDKQIEILDRVLLNLMAQDDIIKEA